MLTFCTEININPYKHILHGYSFNSDYFNVVLEA